jgi:GT2 family glycosyltransferase
MIPTLIVPVLTRYELLGRMLSSIDHPIEQLLVIDNGGQLDPAQVTALTEARGLIEHATVTTLPANLGVAGSWNLGIKATPFSPWWLICNFDIVWPAGALAAFDQINPHDRLALSDGSPPWCAFAIGERVVAEVGLFDEALHPAYFEDNDYERRCHAARVLVEHTSVEVWHDNSSTLNAGYADRNRVTFAVNSAYYDDKVRAHDYSEGSWTLERRRRLSWD